MRENDWLRMDLENPTQRLLLSTYYRNLDEVS
jgi:hypothetical protein